MSAPWRPTCMTDAEYADWIAAARWANETAGVFIPVVCVDCPRSFRREAVREGTCNQQLTTAAAAATAEMRERVIELRSRGLSWAQVGLRMGFTGPRATRRAQDIMRDRNGERAAKRAGVPIYRTKAEMADLANSIFAMREDGMTYETIDRTLGLAPHYAQQIATSRRRVA